MNVSDSVTSKDQSVESVMWETENLSFNDLNHFCETGNIQQVTIGTKPVKCSIDWFEAFNQTAPIFGRTYDL